jgi:osmotically-inducible protein OsmY
MGKTRWNRLGMASIGLGLLAIGLVGFTGDYAAITDEQISAAISRRLAMDGRIDPSLIVIKVEEGRVTLSGMVRTLEEKMLADAVVSGTIVGVRSLVNNIVVTPPVATRDVAIKRAVEEALLTVPVLRGHTLAVSVNKAVVKLEGTVATPLQSRAAQKTAERTQGVVGVVNLIKVTRDVRPDKDIERDVLLYLQWSPLVNIDAFDVRVQNGKVILKGTIDHLAHRYALEEDIEKIRGVVRVDVSDVTVKKPERTA